MSRHPVFLLALLLFLAACTNTPRSETLPTLAQSVDSTPAANATASLLETHVAQSVATNQAALAALSALWTQVAPGQSLPPAPSLTITNTPLSVPAQTHTPEPVVAMEPQLLTIRSLANLRACPDTNCSRLAQLQPSDRVMATGSVTGESINGSDLWYRIDYQGQQAYIYSSLVAYWFPTLPPALPSVQFAAVERESSCNLLTFYTWLNTLTDAYTTIAAVDPALVRAGRDRFAGSPYPQCAATAYTTLLQAFDEAVLSREARQRGDYSTALTHLTNMTQYMDTFRGELTGLYGQLIPSPDVQSAGEWITALIAEIVP